MSCITCNSLKNHGTDEEADAMFDVGIETLNLPMSEKMKFEEGDEGIQFGFVLSAHAKIMQLHSLTQIQSGRFSCCR